jgi:hypothetical protein
VANQASTADGRAIFTVTPHGAGWAVQFEGEMLDPRNDKNEAIAAAHRRARACHDSGRAAQVAIYGEISFAPRAGRA